MDETEELKKAIERFNKMEKPRFIKERKRKILGAKLFKRNKPFS